MFLILLYKNTCFCRAFLSICLWIIRVDNIEQNGPIAWFSWRQFPVIIALASQHFLIFCRSPSQWNGPDPKLLANWTNQFNYQSHPIICRVESNSQNQSEVCVNCFPWHLLDTQKVNLDFNLGLAHGCLLPAWELHSCCVLEQCFSNMCLWMGIVVHIHLVA